MNKLASLAATILIFVVCSKVAFAQPVSNTNDQETSRIIAHVINMDGQEIPVSKGDIQRGVNAAQTSTPAGDTSGKLLRDQIRQLAKDVGLLTETKINPHLSFLGGDIAYWAEQELSLIRLRLEFGARKAVLDAADKAKVVISDQGKLSWAAQEIMAQIVKEKASLNTAKPITQK